MMESGRGNAPDDNDMAGSRSVPWCDETLCYGKGHCLAQDPGILPTTSELNTPLSSGVLLKEKFPLLPVEPK